MTPETIKLFLTLFLTLSTPTISQAQEAVYNAEFCAGVGGETETRHHYDYLTGRSYVQADCETEGTIYEGGLDKRSSLDSIQQALFLAYLTGKAPTVVIYDTDGKMGRYEYQIQVACEMAGVMFLRVKQEE